MPVAEIRRIQRQRQQTIEERLDDLQRRGVLVRSGAQEQTLQPVARRPGALARFLAWRANERLIRRYFGVGRHRLRRTGSWRTPALHT